MPISDIMLLLRALSEIATLVERCRRHGTVITKEDLEEAFARADAAERDWESAGEVYPEPSPDPAGNIEDAEYVVTDADGEGEEEETKDE